VGGPGAPVSRNQASLRRGYVPPFDRPELVDALAQGPWCWPRGLTTARLERCLDGALPERLRAGPPPLAPGVVLLVSAIDRRQGSIWRFGPGAGGGHAATLSQESLRAVQLAARVVARALPLRWRREPRPEDLGRAAIRVDRAAFTNQVMPRESALVGDSCGLAAFLALSSLALGVPVPAHVATSAALAPDGSGGLQRVKYAGTKLRALEALAPRVTKLLVASEQGLDFRPTRIEVVRVKTARQALDHVFEPGAAARRFTSVHDPGEVIEHLLDLTTASGVAFRDWRAVAEAARVALAAWEGALSEEQVARLHLVGMIASRHAYGSWEAPIQAGWLELLPPHRRAVAISHLVQNTTDCGQPSVAVASALAAPYLAGDGPMDLRIRGAWARLIALRGQEDRALELQAENAERFIEMGLVAEATYPLAEWLRLSGATARGEAFEAASRVAGRVERLGGMGYGGQPYVDLARGRAARALGGDDQARALLLPLALREVDPVPTSVQASALRILLPLRPALAPRLSELVKVLPSNARFQALAAIDRALREGGDDRVQRQGEAMETLRAHAAWHLRHLAHEAPTDPRAFAARVARLYPY